MTTIEMFIVKGSRELDLLLLTFGVKIWGESGRVHFMESLHYTINYIISTANIRHLMIILTVF